MKTDPVKFALGKSGSSLMVANSILFIVFNAGRYTCISMAFMAISFVIVVKIVFFNNVCVVNLIKAFI